MAVSIASIQSRLWADQQDIQIAISVIIQKRASVSDGLQDGERPFRLDLPVKRDACCGSDVYELNRRGYGGLLRVGRRCTVGASTRPRVAAAGCCYGCRRKRCSQRSKSACHLAPV